MFFRSNHQDYLVLGKTGPFWFFPTYKIPLKDRRDHMHIVGTTGKGKSKLLEHMIFQDITSGRGVALIDPHGNLADDLLSYLGASGYFKDPKHLDRLVYINPSRRDYSPGINFLELQENEDPAEHANDIIEVFKRNWELETAPVFEDVLFNSLMVLIASKLTILEVPRVVANKAYRDSLLSKIKDPAVHQFFSERFEKWPKREQATRVESTLNKVSRIIGSERLRNIFSQIRSTINFKDILAQIPTDRGRTNNLRLGLLLMT
ncbi:MAG: hypothetical protein DDT23_01318 [candidate division WS2 bacterium]|nr:hypothetical protein [Candidatus Lithacetigena glycinireducens]